MTALNLADTFYKLARNRTAGIALSTAFLGGCAFIPERTVDSCMKRGGAVNILGIVAIQKADEFKKDCDQGRDVAILAATPSSEGGIDYMAALLAAATVNSKSPEIMEHYKKQLQLRGLTHEQVVAAAEKLNREATRGTLVCKPQNGKEVCEYKVPDKIIRPIIPAHLDVGNGPATATERATPDVTSSAPAASAPKGP